MLFKKTGFINKNEQSGFDKENVIGMIDCALGGRAAEEIFLGKEKISAGCSSDFSKATDLAYDYFRKYGMDDKYLISKSKKELPESYNYEIDKKVQELLLERLLFVKNILTENKDLVIKISEELYNKETLSKDDLVHLINSN